MARIVEKVVVLPLNSFCLHDCSHQRRKSHQHESPAQLFTQDVLLWIFLHDLCLRGHSRSKPLHHTCNHWGVESWCEGGRRNDSKRCKSLRQSDLVIGNPEKWLVTSVGYNDNSRSYQIFLNRSQLMMMSMLRLTMASEIGLQDNIKVKMIQTTFVAAETLEETMVGCSVHDQSYE